MTKEQAEQALVTRARVTCEAGDDTDSGLIHSIIGESTAVVGWDSGVVTPCPIADLELEDES